MAVTAFFLRARSGAPAAQGRSPAMAAMRHQRRRGSGGGANLQRLVVWFFPGDCVSKGFSWGILGWICSFVFFWFALGFGILKGFLKCFLGFLNVFCAFQGEANLAGQERAPQKA